MFKLDIDDDKKTFYIVFDSKYNYCFIDGALCLQVNMTKEEYQNFLRINFKTNKNIPMDISFSDRKECEKAIQHLNVLYRLINAK